MKTRFAIEASSVQEKRGGRKSEREKGGEGERVGERRKEDVGLLIMFTSFI